MSARKIEEIERLIGLLIMMQAVTPEKRSEWKVSEMYARLELSKTIAMHDPTRFAAEWLRDRGFTEESWTLRGLTDEDKSDVPGYNPKRRYFTIPPWPIEYVTIQPQHGEQPKNGSGM